jgi:peroxiredoxin Q/BCP
MPLVTGKKAPAWKMAATGDKTVQSKDLLGQNVVLYFYPRDNTPGCTTEAQEFRDHLSDFEKHNTVIFGVSQDPMKSHEKFHAKQSLNFDLLSDPDGVLCGKFDVIKLKKMYGKEFEGIERSTFLIDAKGVLVEEWRKVKVKGHVAEVLERVKQL